jgi:hypothetical protein
MFSSCYSSIRPSIGPLAIRPSCAFLRETVAGRAGGIFTATIMKIIPALNLTQTGYFNKKINRDGPIPPHRPALGPCWIWIGARNDFGYGIFAIFSRLFYAHRVAYTLSKGAISEDKPCILHHCDNTSCVNPSHLFCGTQFDNNIDRTIKGRGKTPLGEKHGKSKLTDVMVRDIRISNANGESRKSLATRMGCSKNAINYVLNWDTWRHVV